MLDALLASLDIAELRNRVWIVRVKDAERSLSDWIAVMLLNMGRRVRTVIRPILLSAQHFGFLFWRKHCFRLCSGSYSSLFGLGCLQLLHRFGWYLSNFCLQKLLLPDLWSHSAGSTCVVGNWRAWSTLSSHCSCPDFLSQRHLLVIYLLFFFFYLSICFIQVWNWILWLRSKLRLHVRVGSRHRRTAMLTLRILAAAHDIT